jgi:hypothetical protein
VYDRDLPAARSHRAFYGPRSLDQIVERFTVLLTHDPRSATPRFAVGGTDTGRPVKVFSRPAFLLNERSVTRKTMRNSFLIAVVAVVVSCPFDASAQGGKGDASFKARHRPVATGGSDGNFGLE